jgi:hypothetical protein
MTDDDAGAAVQAPQEPQASDKKRRGPMADAHKAAVSAAMKAWWAKRKAASDNK